METITLTVSRETKQCLELLQAQGILGMRNGSVEIHFDDEGLIQKMCMKRRRRARPGEKLVVKPVIRGNVVASFDKDGEIGSLSIETEWIRKFALPS